MTTVRGKRILWVIGTIIPSYLLLIILNRMYRESNEFMLAPFLVLWLAMLLVTAFFRLLYSEKSPLWNGIIAFLFWMPLAGWYWLEPNEEAIETRRVYAAIIEVLKIALAHGSIQFLGRWLITVRSKRAV